LFAAKPLVVVANKVDVIPLEQMDPAKREMIERLARESKAPLLPMSAMNAVGITNVKRTACEALLERRVEQKAKTQKVGSILNRLTVATPAGRDNLQRPPTIPDSVLKERASIMVAERDARAQFRQEEAAAYEDEIDAEEAEEVAANKARKEAKPKPAKTARDIMWENGGPGVYSVDLREHYRLHNEEWNQDTMPEIMDGKNVADFIDPDIDRRLEELEREEEQVRQELEHDMELEGSDLDEEEKETVTLIRKAKTLGMKDTQANKKRNAKRMPHAATERSKSRDEIREELEEKGYDASNVRAGGSRKRKREDSVPEEMDVEAEPEDFKTRMRKRGRHDPNPGEDDEDPRRGLRTGEMYNSTDQKKKAIKKFQQSRSLLRNKAHKYSESDNFKTPKLVKHMLVGKRGIGKTDRR